MRLRLVFLFSVLLASPGWAQERVRNVQIRVIDSSQLEIRYDLINLRAGDSVYFDVRSRLRGSLRILPEFVRGDVGRYVTSGTERRIVWDALANGYSLNEEIRAIVLVKTGLSSTPDRPAPSASPVAQQPDVPNPAPSRPEPALAAEPKPSTIPTVEDRPVRGRYTGPAWALLSAVAPGIGNIFVQTPKPKVGIRPLLTVGCYGLLVYGLGQRQKSQDAYAIYLEQKNMAAGEPYYQTANAFHQRYFLATRGAIVLAAADVILTFIRGVRNNKVQRHGVQAVTVWPGLQAGQLTAVARYSF